MKINIPKGSYHEFCRKKYVSQSAHQSQRSKLAKITRGQTSRPQHFDNFQSYLIHLQTKQQRERQSQTERHYRTADNSRPRTQILIRKIQPTDEEKQFDEPIKPFFPFYRCRIESTSRPSREGKDVNFRVSNKRFKVNYRIIEENMGKYDQNLYW